MTFENTCRNCPHAQFVGNILFRSCSVAKKGHGNTYIECGMRPELGFFEPSIRKNECPVWNKSGQDVLITLTT
jgi:hypothetical protein